MPIFAVLPIDTGVLLVYLLYNTLYNGGPMRDPYLVQRGKQFYLRLAIPRPIRPLFPSGSGKARDFVVEPLGRNFDPARVECDRRVADYRALFARAPLMTADAVQVELQAIKQRAESRKIAADLPMLASELDDIRERTRTKWEDVQRFYRSPEYLQVAREQEHIHREVERITKGLVPEGSQAWNEIAEKVVMAMSPRHQLTFPQAGEPAAQGQTVTQAAELWFAEMERPDAGVRPQTLDGHRLRVRAFVEKCGDLPLSSVTRAIASVWLAAVANGRSNRTTNNYCMTMQCLFKSARNRGRFQGENPFEDQRRKAAGEKREAFTAAEIHKLFAALPVEVLPRKHSPETALPWVTRIAAFSGMRLEEAAQLNVRDIRTVGVNGGSLVCLDIHNGGNNHLKSESSARVIPVHSELCRAGLLDYLKALPQDGPAFPGLSRRASKGGKIGARLGELFRKRLVALGIKRVGLCFHSLRNTVANRLEAAAVSQTDAARVLGHAIEGMSYGVYSSGPGLKRLAAVVEEISYSQ